MAITTHRGILYPGEYEDPYYASFASMIGSIDDDIDRIISTDNLTIYVNKSTVGYGVLSFNNGAATISLNNSTDLNVQNLKASERFHVNYVTDSTADFDTRSAAWAMRVANTVDFNAWGAGYAGGIAGLFECANQLNDTEPEVAAISGWTYNYSTDSLAGVVSGDFMALQSSASTAENTFIGVQSYICSPVDPTVNLIDGCGFSALSQDAGAVTGVRQFSGFYSRGTRGWKYPFISVDTDGITTLFYVDQDGAVMAVDEIATAANVRISSTGSNYFQAASATPGLWMQDNASAKMMFVCYNSTYLAVQRYSSGSTYETNVMLISVSAPSESMVMYNDGSIKFADAISVWDTITSSSEIHAAAGFFYGSDQVVGARQPLISSPSGGTSAEAADMSARSAIDNILSLLTAHGLMSGV